MSEKEEEKGGGEILVPCLCLLLPYIHIAETKGFLAGAQNLQIRGISALVFLQGLKDTHGVQREKESELLTRAPLEGTHGFTRAHH